MLSQLPNATAQNMASNTTVAEGRPIYIGDTAQLSMGITNNARMHFELNGVLHESDRHTWLGEGWTSHGAGGVKLSHHKFNGQDSVHHIHVIARPGEHHKSLQLLAEPILHPQPLERVLASANVTRSLRICA